MSSSFTLRLSLDLAVPLDVITYALIFKTLPTCRPFGPQQAPDLPEAAFEDFHLATLAIPLDPHPESSGFFWETPVYQGHLPIQSPAGT